MTVLPTIGFVFAPFLYIIKSGCVILLILKICTIFIIYAKVRATGSNSRWGPSQCASVRPYLIGIYSLRLNR